MTHVLVTGAAGFIGSAIARALAARGDRVTGIDLAVGPALAALAEAHGNVTAAVCEITEWASLIGIIRAQSPDAIVHCAAIVGVIHAVQAPQKTMRVNVEGAMTLFEAMHLFDIPRMVHMSSEETYGHFQAPVIDESHPQNPLMAYGISKLAVEHLGRSYAAQYGIEVINMRTCWAYGPGLPRPRVPKTLVDAAVAGRPLHLPGGADWVVDHTYIDDVVAGVLLALDKADHPYDAYNLASGYAPTLSEVVGILKDLVPGADLTVGPGVFQHGDAAVSALAVRKGALDISRARDVLGYAPRYDIRAGLAAYVEAVRSGAGR